MSMPFFPLRVFLVVAALGFSGLASTSVRADEPSLVVRDGWVRWLPGGLPAAGYLTLVNDSDADRFVTGVTSADYGHAMLHESYTDAGGAAGMRGVDRLRVPAHGEVALAPGGYHLMLMKPRRKIAPGDTVAVTIRLENGPTIDVTLPVKPAASTE